MRDDFGRGSRFKKAMGDRTYADVADAAGVSKSTICGYAVDGKTPNIEIALAVCEILNLDLNYWIFGVSKASSGRHHGPSAAEEAVSFAETLETLGRPVETLFRVLGSGNLMAPTIPHGAEVTCSKEISNLNDGCVYLIAAAGGEVVLRRLRIRLDGSLEALCDNPNFASQTEIVSRDKFIAEALLVLCKL